MMGLTISERLMYSTIYIECRASKTDDIPSIGTGFFFNFVVPPCRHPIPFIITNKHVIKNSYYGKLRFTLASDDFKPLDEQYFDFDIPNFKNLFISHPDESIDLCAMPLGPILSDLEHMYNKKLFFIALDSSIIASLNTLSVVEDVLMVGYPNGIWDEVNNKPIFRKGITATHPRFNYNGKREFLIDIACFPGSSGSPVFIYNENGYIDKNNLSYNLGSTRLLFAGVMMGGHEYFISTIDDTGYDSNVYTKIPNNLGVVIKSDTLIDLQFKIGQQYYIQWRSKAL